MIEYRIRAPFRLAAAFLAPFLLLGGGAFVVLGAAWFGEAARTALIAITLGILSFSLGFLFARIALRGRVPAAIEEYGLDDQAEVAESRAAARTVGMLVE